MSLYSTSKLIMRSAHLDVFLHHVILILRKLGKSFFAVKAEMYGDKAPKRLTSKGFQRSKQSKSKCVILQDSIHIKLISDGDSKGIISQNLTWALGQ